MQSFVRGAGKLAILKTFKRSGIRASPAIKFEGETYRDKRLFCNLQYDTRFNDLDVHGRPQSVRKRKILCSISFTVLS